MKKPLLVALIFVMLVPPVWGENQKAHDERMEWWREARFGLFIHWGLYAIPAGEWGDETGHAEWIRTTAQIPLKEYDQLVHRFNPVKFDADAWVRMAKEAGMKYIVITTKHHDGFSLFDSDQSDFDVMATPFNRDIMAELAEACRKYGLKICWYHSIMDWHHPDYLPRRNWEDRSLEGAQFDRYVSYMKNQLRELVQNYGDIGVLWFDGEWEESWNQTYGRELYDYLRDLQPSIIINNRVGAGRAGMAGLTRDGEFAGDFGTPEQEIPPTGLPDVDWETCMTMNNNWGFNSHDNNWKSTADLIRKLADIASKGGNFLLNVGPTAEGLFPQPSIDRLAAIGDWMRINGESIYGTRASPFNNLSWARCTQKPIDGGTRLYFHLFDWPDDGRLMIPGIYNEPKQAFLLAQPGTQLQALQEGDSIIISLPVAAPDSINSVVVVDVPGRADVNNPPTISAEHEIFIDELKVSVASPREDITIHYTLDGSEPSVDSPRVDGPLSLTNSTEVTAKIFRDGQAISGYARTRFSKVRPRKGEHHWKIAQGLNYGYYEGVWDKLPLFGKLSEVEQGIVDDFDPSPALEKDNFGFLFEGLIKIAKEGIYTFYTGSDDGSQLFIGDDLVVDNDGLHGMSEESGTAALGKGLHPIRVTFFEKNGASDLKVSYRGPGVEKQTIPPERLFRLN